MSSSSHHSEEEVFMSDSELESERSAFEAVSYSSVMAIKFFQTVVSQHFTESSSQPKEKHTHTYINRKCEKHHDQMMEDYFADNCEYTANKFRWRFRMTKSLFLRIVEAISNHDPCYFRAGPDATGRQALSNLQKCTAAMRMLAYGLAADVVDEYTRCSETSALKALNKFCDSVLAVFALTYMRRANEEDINQLLAINARRGFSGMIRSIDCMHWEWKYCSIAWTCQYQGKSGKLTLVLEVVASHDTWIWHSFFGVSGKFNDLTIVARSPVFDDLLNSVTPPVNFEVNGHHYNMAYYLTDGNYPSWATFVKSKKKFSYSQRDQVCT